MTPKDDFKEYVRSILTKKKELYKKHLKLLDFQGVAFDGKYNTVNGVLNTPQDLPDFKWHTEEMKGLLDEISLIMSLLRKEA